jgi:hypothetical protein
MNAILKLGSKMDECKRHLCNHGYTYDEADQMTKMTFDETEMKNYGVFDSIPRNVINDAINHLDKELLQS